MDAPLLPLVLIVDDEDNREALGLLVRLWGFDVRLARDGTQALAAFRAFRPRAVLLDIHLTDMDGWEVGHHLREQGGPRLVLVALTSFGGEDDRARSHEAGLDAHLLKPFEPDELRRLLDGLTPVDGCDAAQPCPTGPGRTC
jgi:CheY-like chemotaxis protein